MEHPFISTLLRSGPVGQTILAALLLLSIYTWTVIFSKLASLRSAEKKCRDFLARFRENPQDWLDTTRGAVEGPLGPLWEAGRREYRAQLEVARPGEPIGAEGIARIESALETETVDRIADLEKGHLVLAVASSASPFVGLFGTVWGIMNAFRGMSLEGSAGIAAVAPGVAEALVTTVAGLAVAIPAVVAYNFLNRRVQLVTALIDRFSTEFVRTADLASRRRAPAAAPESGVFARR
ncbi:MAG: MotA/TolQ/ExbB proton channel family protein [bacterium]|nr:MotA/TolQ/ExbB proton channel family protein [Gemmatimonadota bacterium]